MVVRFLLLCTLLFSGCTVHRELVPENKQCDKLAWYARSVAVLRDIGMAEQEIGLIQNAPTQATFPAIKVRREVFALNTKNPADTYTIFYSKCYAAGFENVAALFDEDQYIRLNPKVKEEKLVKIAKLEKADPIIIPKIAQVKPVESPVVEKVITMDSVIPVKPPVIGKPTIQAKSKSPGLSNVKWKNNKNTEVYQEISNIKWDSWDDRSSAYRDLIRRRN